MLTILTTNYGTTDLIELQLECLQKLTLQPFRYIVCDNGSPEREVERLSRISHGIPGMFVMSRNMRGQPASVSHSTALDLMTPMVETPEFVILDSDAIPLMRGWDAYMASKLAGDVVVVGAPQDPRFSGSPVLNFPQQFMTMWKTDAYQQGGYRVACDLDHGHDTCYSWPDTARERGDESYLMGISNTRLAYYRGRFAGLTGVEEYSINGGLIGSHLGRGATGGVPKFLKGASFPGGGAIRRWLAWRDKRRWMRICREIVREEEKRCLNHV